MEFEPDGGTPPQVAPAGGFVRGGAGDVAHPGLAENAVSWRDYQVSIATACLETNTLVVLPTGLGKTVIAALVVAERLLVPPGRTLFLAPTRPLVLQHEDRLRVFLKGPPSVISVTGQRRSKERRATEQAARVVVATPQVVVNDLAKGHFDLASFSLVVFDEAHRAVGDYQYVDVGKALQALPPERRPLVLALTASPGHEEDRILDVRRKLLIEKVESRTADDSDVVHHTHRLSIEWRRVPFPQFLVEPRDRLQKLQDERVAKLRRLGFLRHKKNTQVTKRDILEVGGQLGVRMKKNRAPYLFAGFLHQGVALHTAICLELLECEGVEALRGYISRVGTDEPKRKDKAFLSDRHTKAVLRFLEEQPVEAHPKFDELARVLDETFRPKSGAKAMVFAQYRDTVATIVAQLGGRGVTARRFVGQAARGAEKGMTQDEQRATIAAFERGAFQVLVASSVGEEGIDIPAVDLVVFFEALPSEIRSIQRRGRAGRTAAGRVVVLITAGTRDEKMAYAGLAREKKMRRLVQQMRKPKSSMRSALDAWEQEEE
jgi:Fanconi anemia group M protein